MWYDSKDKEWRVVKGLPINIFYHSKMVEHNGYLLLLAQYSLREKREIKCAMIVLDRSGVEN